MLVLTSKKTLVEEQLQSPFQEFGLEVKPKLLEAAHLKWGTYEQESPGVQEAPRFGQTASTS